MKEFLNGPLNREAFVAFKWAAVEMGTPSNTASFSISPGTAKRMQKFDPGESADETVQTAEELSKNSSVYGYIMCITDKVADNEIVFTREDGVSVTFPISSDW